MENLEAIQNYNQTTQTGDLGRDARLKINNNFTKVKEAINTLETSKENMEREILDCDIDGGKL